MSASQPSPEIAQRSGSYWYRLYGLNVRSAFPLPELRESEDARKADLDIRVGRVSRGHADGWSFGPDGAILRIEEIGSYLIRGGREIIVEKRPDAAERNMRLYLLGSAMGVLLHQRGLLPLHANAIEIDGCAVAFMGESGAGKSTLAAWSHDAGHRVIADDVCVLRFDDGQGRVSVHPGLPRIRLWKDALERTGREPGDYDFSYAGDETYEKFDVPVPQEASAAAELDLAAIYLLSDGISFGISRLTAAEAVEAVFSHTYRGFVVSELGRTQPHFDAAVKLVRNVPIFRLERRRELADIEADIPRVIAHARQLVRI